MPFNELNETFTFTDFKQSSTLTEHERIHRNERPFECHICQRTFIQNGSLLNHLKIHTDSRQYKCKICEKGFNQVSTLQKHVKSHERQMTKERTDCTNLMGELLKESRINECQESNELPLQLLETGEVDQEMEPQFEESVVVDVASENIVESDLIYENVQKLPQVDKKAVKILKSTRKKRSCVSKRLMQCEICGWKMKFSEKKFVNHYRTRHFPDLDIQTTFKNHACLVCGRTFVTPTDLQIHNRIHTGERPYKCETCEKTFTTSSNLKIHQHVHNGSRDYLCTSCPKRYARNSDLKVHLRSHTNERKFKCHLCPSAFRQSSVLSQHIRSHTNERPFVCQICTKAFKSSGTLSVHMRGHRNERKFACDVCNKRFLTGSDLRKHQFLHTGQLPFECQTCAKRFPFAGHLKKHERSHTSDRERHSCKACEIKFLGLSELKRHNLEVHTIICWCGEKFSENEFYEAHLSRSHGS